MPEQVLYNRNTNQYAIWDQQLGDYRIATPQEFDVIESGASGQALAAFEGGTGAMSLAELLTPGAPGGMAEALQTVNPTASSAGLAASLLPVGAGVGNLARRGLQNRMAGRVAQRASRGTVEIDQPLRPGIAERAGFGQNTMIGRGLDQVESVAESIPVAGLFTAARLAKNQRIINMRFARALGADDAMVARAAQGVDENVMRNIQQGFQRDFGRVAEGITDGMDPIRARAEIQQVMDSGLVTNVQLRRAIENGNAVTGRQLQNIRSELTDQLRRDINQEVRNEVMDRIDAIDNIIEDALQGTDLQDVFQTARARYRLWSAARKGAARGKTGNINVRSMDTNLGQRVAYGDNYLAGNPIAGAPDEINEFLATVREANQIGQRTFDPRAATRSTLLGVAGIAAGSQLFD